MGERAQEICLSLKLAWRLGEGREALGRGERSERERKESSAEFPSLWGTGERRPSVLRNEPGSEACLPGSMSVWSVICP